MHLFLKKGCLTMQKKNSKHIIFPVILLMMLLSGCSSHGKLSMAPKAESDSLLAELMANTDQYLVHYHGNSEKIVSGILFDPRKDTKTIRPEGVLWVEVNDAETIADIIDSIKRSNFPGYLPRLYRIISADGDFYGYLFTGWQHLVIQTVDRQTVRVYGLEGPPEYMDIGPGASKRYVNVAARR